MPQLDPTVDAIQLAPQVELLCLPEPRFKRAQVQIHFDRPLDQRSPARTLLAEVLEQGSARLPSQMEWTRALEELYGAGLSFGGDRAGERHRMTQILSWVGEPYLPDGERLLEEVLRLAREMLEKPRRGDNGEPFAAGTVERERAELLRYIASLSDRRALYARERFLAAMCAGEPFGRAPYGTAEEVRALSAQDLEEARRDLLLRAPVTIVAVGPVDAPRLEDELRRQFAPAAARAPLPPAAAVAPGPLREIREPLPVDQARLVFGFRCPVPRSPAELEALSLANSILGGGTHGRLFREVRERRSLAYGIYSLLYTFKGILAVEAGIDAASYQEVRDQVLHHAQELAAGRFGAEEMEVARVNLAQSLEAFYDSPAALAQHHGREHLLGFGRSPAQRVADLRAIGHEEVCAAAARWRPDLVYFLSGGTPG